MLDLPTRNSQYSTVQALVALRDGVSSRHSPLVRALSTQQFESIIVIINK